jgi:hypothetical protein
MSIFGLLTMSNGMPLRTPSPGDSGGGVGGLTTITAMFIGVVASLGLSYYATSVLGNEKTPLGVVYTFAIAFQVTYVLAWNSFWVPITSNLPEELTPVTLIFFGLFTFLVESIFAIGFIQMTTGGWGAYQ